MSNLEEELEETRAQAESDAESWKARLAKAKDAERVVLDREREIKEELRRLHKAAEGAKGRIGELEGALKENNGALEGARAEIEGLRGEAAVSHLLISAFQVGREEEGRIVADNQEATTMRAALADLTAKEQALAEKTEQVEELKKRVERLDEVETKCKSAEEEKDALQQKSRDLEAKVTGLEQEMFNVSSS